MFKNKEENVCYEMVLLIPEITMTKFICRRGGECIYRDTEGRCNREPQMVAVDKHGCYDNKSTADVQYPKLINLATCRFQGRELQDGEKLTKTRGRKKWI